LQDVTSLYSGNYMYGTGNQGYFEMATTGTNLIFGLEFITFSGFGDPYSATWTAFLNGGAVASGTVNNLLQYTILGFASVTGFDTLRYTTNRPNFANTVGPAFDSVRAMYTSPVPVPAAVWLLGTALIGLVGFGKRRVGVST